MNLTNLFHKQSLAILIFYILAVIVSLIVYNLNFSEAYGTQFSQRYISFSSSQISATGVTFRLGFDLSSNLPIGSIEIQFCQNSPLFQDPCIAPSGLSTNNVNLISQTGQINFHLLVSTQPNVIILSRTPSVPTLGAVSYAFNNLTNASMTGSEYVRIQTFSSIIPNSADVIEHGGLAYALDNQILVNAEVPPFLYFCSAVVIPQFNCDRSSGSNIDFGNFSPQQTSTATSQLLVGTNGQNGYTISVYGSGLVSGINQIPNLFPANVSRLGVSQFGLNLVSNISPVVGQNPTGPGHGQPLLNYNEPNFYAFENGSNIAGSNQPENYRLYTVSYLVNVANNQPPGVYVMSVNYVCVANF